MTVFKSGTSNRKLPLDPWWSKSNLHKRRQRYLSAPSDHYNRCTFSDFSWFHIQELELVIHWKSQLSEGSQTIVCHIMNLNSIIQPIDELQSKCIFVQKSFLSVVTIGEVKEWVADVDNLNSVWNSPSKPDQINGEYNLYGAGQVQYWINCLTHWASSKDTMTESPPQGLAAERTGQRSIRSPSLDSGAISCRGCLNQRVFTFAFFHHDIIFLWHFRSERG